MLLLPLLTVVRTGHLLQDNSKYTQCIASPNDCKRLHLNVTGTSGTIPDDINLLTALTSLTISGNDISGTLPSALFTLTNLERFYASDNKLSGTLSSSLGDLTMLAGLDLYQNHFSGMIPGEIGHLTGLQYLDLADNSFKGAEHGICAILLNSWFRKKPTGVTTSCTLRDAGRDGSWRNSEWDPTLCPVCLNDHHWCEPPRACTGGVEYHTFTGLQGGVGTTVETSFAGANSSIFTVTDTGTGSPRTYAVSITTPGSGYVSQITAPETIVVKGTLLGGVDGAPPVGNDCTLTVAGAIDFAGFSAAHAAVTETSAAGGGTATVTVHSTGTGGVYSFTVTAPGTNYAIGDKLVILGSSFGGVDGTNDCTITTDAAGGFAGTAAGSPAAIAAAGLSATNVVVSGTAPGNTSFSSNPTSVPTATPSSHPTADPSTAPTTTPTADPSTAPTSTAPTIAPTLTAILTASPTATPTAAPSDLPGGPAEWYFPLGASVDVIGAARRRLGAAGRRILQVFGSTGSSEAAQEDAEGL